MIFFSSMNKLREETTRAYELSKQKQKNEGCFGYGGKFGIEKDRMDKSAVGHDYVAKVEKHVSQTDYSTGFGGKFGVQTDRVDKVTDLNKFWLSESIFLTML